MEDDNKLHLTFDRLEDIEQLLYDEFEVFIEKIAVSQNKISMEKMAVEHAIIDFEKEVKDAMVLCKNSHSMDEITRYNQMLKKIRSKWGFLKD
jgi:hypothetical protein